MTVGTVKKSIEPNARRDSSGTFAMSATAGDAAASPAWRQFARRPQCPTCPTRRGFEERPRADSRRQSSSRGSEWSPSCSGGLHGPVPSAASTGGGAIGDANARRCQGARRSGLCANPRHALASSIQNSRSRWRSWGRLTVRLKPPIVDGVRDSRARPLGVHRRSAREIEARRRAKPA